MDLHSHLSTEHVGPLRVVDVGVGHSADIVATVSQVHFLYHQAREREGEGADQHYSAQSTYIYIAT